MSEQLTFKVSDATTKFNPWLKRFASINKSLLLEVDLIEEQFIAKTYNEERSAVKFSQTKFSDVGFEISSKNPPPTRIKVGLYDILNIIKSFSHFSDDLSVTIKYAELKDGESKQFVGKQVLLKNDSLKVGFDCTSLNIFNYISDDVFMNVVCKVNKVLDFDLKEDDLNKINNLSDLDKEYKKLEFKAADNKVLIRSKSFELNLGICGDESGTLPILKDQFSKLDSENYNVIFGDRLVFKSIDSQTITVLSGLDLNDYDKDDTIEL